MNGKSSAHQASLSGADLRQANLTQCSLRYADLRGFTELSEATPPREVIEALDAWFDRVAGAVHDRRAAAEYRGQVERGAAEKHHRDAARGHDDVGPGIEQQLHQLGLPRGKALHERGISLRVRHVGIGPGLEQGVRDAEEGFGVRDTHGRRQRGGVRGRLVARGPRHASRSRNHGPG